MKKTEEKLERRSPLPPAKLDSRTREGVLKLVDQARQKVAPTVRAERAAEQEAETTALLRFK